MKIFLVLLFSSCCCLAMAQLNYASTQRAGARSSLAPFYHGVASGDPLSDAVIIWTRVTTTDTAATVNWRVATDTTMMTLVDSGTAVTTNALDYTVKVDVSNLQPNQFYYYEFEYNGQLSVIGRTKTAPVGEVDSLRFAVVSCASYAHGFFNVYDRIRERNDVAAVLHLGDYYYEYGDNEYGGDRSYQPSTEITNLSDYRMRLSHYRLDASLMRLHQQYPFICIWDDHETANNSWEGGADNHDGGEGNWFNRKAEAIKAYYEWMPVRMPAPAVDSQRIYRTFRYGDLVELHMLDTRLEGREEQGWSDANAVGRTILGKPQFDWLCHNMDTSTAQWQVLGQQVMMAPFDVNPLPFGRQYGNSDQWDGYETERRSLYDSIFANNVQNVVVLTGDIHTSWANDLPTPSYDANTGAGSAGVEFVVTSVTSPGLAAAQSVGAALLRQLNDHMKYIELSSKGYYIFDVNKTRAQADWYYVDRIDQVSATENYATSWKTDDQSRHLTPTTGAALPNSSQIGVPAPFYPRSLPINTANLQQMDDVLLSVYPNPFKDQLTLQYTLTETGPVQLYLLDALGRTLASQDLGDVPAGLQRATLTWQNLVPGTYILLVDLNGKKQQRILIKR
ncbi:MAG: alkaline phosphatase D family protein [Aureispira sp.]